METFLYPPTKSVGYSCPHLGQLAYKRQKQQEASLLILFEFKEAIFLLTTKSQEISEVSLTHTQSELCVRERLQGLTQSFKNTRDLDGDLFQEYTLVT